MTNEHFTYMKALLRPSTPLSYKYY